jgi:hypothetical protein
MEIDVFVTLVTLPCASVEKTGTCEAEPYDPADPVFVSETVICPVEPDEIPIPVPAAIYEVPSANFVNDPLNPALNLTAPVKVEPLMVATTELSIPSVTLLFAPASVSVIPAPLERERSLERFASLPIVTNADVDGARLGAAMVIEPFDPVVTVTFVPARRYEVPSESFVSEPERPLGNFVVPEMVFVPPEFPILIVVAPDPTERVVTPEVRRLKVVEVEVRSPPFTPRSPVIFTFFVVLL